MIEREQTKPQHVPKNRAISNFYACDRITCPGTTFAFVGRIVNCDGSWDFLPLFFCPSSSSCINHDRKTSSFYAEHTCMKSTHGSQQKAHTCRSEQGEREIKDSQYSRWLHSTFLFYAAKHIQERYWEAITTLGVRIWGETI